MEVNGIGKPLFIAEASAANLDHFNSAIEAFCRTVTDLQHNRIQYAPQMFFDRNYSPLRLSTSLPRWIYNRFFMSVEA